MDNCVFCNRQKIEKDILAESPSFMVMVGLGVITPGHVLLTSTEHLSCYGALPSSLKKEFLKTRSIVSKTIEEIFAKPFQIEYGVWGQTVPHAHIHFIPRCNTDYSVDSIMDELFSYAGVPIEKASFERMQEIFREDKGYIMIEESENIFVARVLGLPPINQFPALGYRQFFTNKKNIKHVGDWRTLNDSERIYDEQKRNDTKRLLSESLKVAFKKEGLS